MDTGKLLKIIQDIQKDEQDFNLQARFQNILNFYNDNNAEALNNEKVSISSDLEKSILINYVMTDFKALEQLRVDEYFGIESNNEINRILNSQAHEVKQKLEEFLQKRQDSLNKLDAIKNSLTAVDLKPRILGDDQY